MVAKKSGQKVYRSGSFKRSLVEEYKRSNLSICELARRHDVAESTLYSWIKCDEAGNELPSDNKSVASEELQNKILIEYQTTSITLNKIASKYGIPASTINNWIVRRGARKRNKPALNPDTLKSDAEKIWKRIEQLENKLAWRTYAFVLLSIMLIGVITVFTVAIFYNL